MRFSVGSPVVPRNCHQCPRPDWGHVTANTSVVCAVCGPEIIFPELSLKNKDELKWEKASACPPSSSTSFLCALYSHRAGRDKDKLVAAADDNPSRDLPSRIGSSSALLPPSGTSLCPSPSHPCEHCTLSSLLRTQQADCSS